MSESLSPQRVAVSGDWHGNTMWAVYQLHRMRELVPESSPLIVLHLGDFGWWPGAVGQRYTDALAHACQSLEIRLWVTPGNHEDYTQVYTEMFAAPDPVRSTQLILALPRGTRWRWHGRTWLSVGGAASPDSALRVPGRSWWPEETLKTYEAAAVAAAGPADVLLTHDVGDRVQLSLPPWPRHWGESAQRECDQHRILVQHLARDITPQHWLHGHYHHFHQQTLEMGWGPCSVTGLSCDGESGNWGVLNAENMNWECFNHSQPLSEVR